MTGSASEPEGEERDVQPIPPAHGGGLSGSFADRLAGGAAPVLGEPAPRFMPAEPEDASLEGEPARHSSAPPPRATTPASSRGGTPARRRDRTEDEVLEEVGPSWERPRRREAYPTLRTRMGLGSVSMPPVMAGLGAVVLAALALFFLPSILGIGNPAATGAPSATPGPSAVAASPTSAEPTAIPEPTPQVYLVQSGDTMSRIAVRFGVPLQVLIDANKVAIPNPDSLAIGQEVIIPSVAPTSVPDSPVVTEAPSATP
jgi:LysM repeat protein